jgi:3-phenylpropionate/trans-cinnamate dioxygenase ferredoxin subunit
MIRMMNNREHVNMGQGADVAEKWVTVAKEGYLEPGELMYVEVEDEPVVLINLDGELHALNDTCTHEDASLSDGTIVGDEIECPLHGGAFYIRTGEPASMPVVVKTEKYKVRTVNGEVQVSLSQE